MGRSEALCTEYGTIQPTYSITDQIDLISTIHDHLLYFLSHLLPEITSKINVTNLTQSPRANMHNGNEKPNARFGPNLTQVH